jgi:hypothetical protein
VNPEKLTGVGEAETEGVGLAVGSRISCGIHPEAATDARSRKTPARNL